MHKDSSVCLNVCCTVANACVVKELMSNLEQHVMASVRCIFLKALLFTILGIFWSCMWSH